MPEVNMEPTCLRSEACEVEWKAPAMIALDGLYEEIATLGKQLEDLENRLDIVLNPAIHNSKEGIPPGNEKNKEQTSVLTYKLDIAKGEVGWMRDKVAFIDKYLEL